MFDLERSTLRIDGTRKMRTKIFVEMKNIFICCWLAPPAAPSTSTRWRPRRGATACWQTRSGKVSSTSIMFLNIYYSQLFPPLRRRTTCRSCWTASCRTMTTASGRTLQVRIREDCKTYLHYLEYVSIYLYRGHV